MHGRDVKFYKYLGPDSSLAVLENRTLKWSNPKLFNDPFDLPTEIAFSFDGDELAEALIAEIIELSYGPEEPEGNIENPLYAMSLINRKSATKPGADVFREYMAPAMRDTAHRFKNGQEGLRSFYRTFRDQFAVLCVSKKRDDLLMWAHYAQDHTGCVFMFRCMPEMDRPLCMAHEVKYKPEYPVMAELSDYVKHLTGQVELDYDELFKVFAFTKSDHWSYEKEWRCISLLKNRESGYDFDPIVPEELEAVYLGCRASDPFRKSILALIEEHYPATVVYQAQTEIRQFRLKFEQIR